MKKKKVLACMLAATMSMNAVTMTTFAEEQNNATVVQNGEAIQNDESAQNSEAVVQEAAAISNLEIKNQDGELNTVYPLGTFRCADGAYNSMLYYDQIKIKYQNGEESDWQWFGQLLDSGAKVRVRDSKGSLVETENDESGLTKTLPVGSYQMNLEIDGTEYKLYDFDIKNIEDCVTQTLTLDNKVDIGELYYKNDGNVTKINVPDNAVYKFAADSATTDHLTISDVQGDTEVWLDLDSNHKATCYLTTGTYYIYKTGEMKGLSMTQKKVRKIEIAEKPDGTQNLYMQDEFSSVNDTFWQVHSKVNDALKFRITYQDGSNEDMTYEQFGKLRNYTGVLSFWKVGSSDYNEWLMDNQTGLYYEVLMLEGEGYTWEDPIAEIPVYVSKRFPDVPEGRWDYPYIGKISAVGIMNGMGNGEFNSTGTLVRAQFATTLYRMSGSPDVEYSTKFPDVADEQFYTKPILWASKVGVANGYANGNFGPGDNINREQMATMMYNYAKNEGYDISSKKSLEQFSDGQYVSTYAKNAMEWAVANGIITGKDSGTRLDPQGLANRGECAAILLRFLEKYVY